MAIMKISKIFVSGSSPDGPAKSYNVFPQDISWYNESKMNRVSPEGEVPKDVDTIVASPDMSEVGGSEEWHRERARYHSCEAERLEEQRLHEEAYQRAVTAWTVNQPWDSEREVFVTQVAGGELTQTLDEAISIYNPDHPAGRRTIEFLESFREQELSTTKPQ